jgi:transcriptional regulator with XRE-family HTH domain
MSQWAVGDAAGLDHNYIGMIERGERNPAVVNVVKIAKALGGRLESCSASSSDVTRRGDDDDSRNHSPCGMGGHRGERSFRLGYLARRRRDRHGLV